MCPPLARGCPGALPINLFCLPGGKNINLDTVLQNISAAKYKIKLFEILTNLSSIALCTFILELSC